MILFPLMTTWMWFQILTASPLPSPGHLVGDACGAGTALRSVRFERGGEEDEELAL
jgi:hypothetical protein